MFDDLHNGILPILPSREFITLVFDQIQQINNRKSAQRCIICYLPRRQGRQQWLLKSNSSNTWFDTIFLVSEIHNECHTCLYYLGTWLWSEACYVLMISFRNCEIWQSVKIAPFKLLTSGNCHNFTFLNSLFVVFLVPWNLKKVVCLQEQIMISFWRSQTKSGICDIRWFSRPLSNSYMNFATLGVTLVNPKPRPYMVRIYYIQSISRYPLCRMSIQNTIWPIPP